MLLKNYFFSSHTISFRIVFLIITCAICFGFVVGYKKPTNQSLQNNTFSPGEKLIYRVHYGFLNAGRAELEIHNKFYKVEDKVCYKINVYGKSIGSFDFFTRIRDHWGTYIDTSSLIPLQSYRYVQEGKYKLKEEIYYDQEAHKATRKVEGQKDEFYTLAHNVQDIVSGFYYLRAMDFSKIKTGDTISIDAFFENKGYAFQMKYLGIEEMDTDIGKFRSYVISPIMPPNPFFKGDNSVKVWLTADLNKIPLKAKASTYLGAIEMDIEHAKGLRYELGQNKKLNNR